jgi:redox-sensitive bicupin YhaK (pirin superfamily)
MEILTYVLDGALEHRDSMGNGSVIRPGDVQRMSAGTGVRHSEYNASRSAPVHFLQIWLRPSRSGVNPGYGQRHFDPAERRGRLRLLVSPDGREHSIAAHQEAFVYGTLLGDGQTVEHRPGALRRAYVHLARGQADLNGLVLAAGDGARIEDEATMRLTGDGEAEALVFDLP